MEFTELQKKYRNFYAPAFEITVGGINLVEAGMEIVHVSVDHSLREADYFTVTVNNAFDPVKQELLWVDSLAAIGTKVEIKMGYADRLQSLLIGFITSVTASFPDSGASQLTISGYDLSYSMMKGMKLRAWDNTKHSEIARIMASEYSLKSDVEDTYVQHPKVMKIDGASDFHFLRQLAEKNYFEFFVFGEKLVFRAPAKNTEPIMTLEWRKNLLSFNPEINVKDQLSEVEVRGWDPNAKKEIIGKANAGDELHPDRGMNRKSGSELVKGLYRDKVVQTIRYPVFSQAEADRLAQSVLNKHAEGLVEGSAETIGIPDIVPGNCIKLGGMGKKFSNIYYIEKSRHSISGSGYRTSFHVKENTI